MNSSTVKKPFVKSITGARLNVKDLAKMTEWYSQLLDMPIDSFNEKNPFYIFDMENRVDLSLDTYRNVKGQSKHPICQMKTDDIESAYAIVRESQIPVIKDIERPHPGLAYFNMEDSEGNALLIVESDWVNPNPITQNDSNHPIKNQLGNVIPVKDLKRATEWYSKLLGNPIKPDRQDGGPIYWFDLEDGSGVLLDDNRNNQDLDSYPTFILNARNIHGAYDFVKKKNIEVVREIQFDHYFMIKDIEGNTIMVCL